MSTVSNVSAPENEEFPQPIRSITQQQLRKFFSICEDLVPSVNNFAIAAYDTSEKGLTSYGKEYRDMQFRSSLRLPAQQFRGSIGGFANPWFLYNYKQRIGQRYPTFGDMYPQLQKKYILVHWDDVTTYFEFYLENKRIGKLTLNAEFENETAGKVEEKIFKIPFLTSIPKDENMWQPVFESSIFHEEQCEPDLWKSMKDNAVEVGSYFPLFDNTFPIAPKIMLSSIDDTRLYTIVKRKHLKISEFVRIDGRILFHLPFEEK